MFWTKEKAPEKIADTAKLLEPGSTTLSLLTRSLDFLRSVVTARLSHHFGATPQFVQPQFKIVDDGSPFARFVIHSQITIEEFLTLLLALAPHLHPDLFSDLIKIHMPKGGDFPEFGGIKGHNYRGILPTGETALFILAGMNIDRRLQYSQWLRGEKHYYRNDPAQDRPSIFQDGVVVLEPPKDGEPEMSGRLIIPQDKVTEFLTGERWIPRFGINFPASHLESEMEWKDLVLSPGTHRELSMIRFWLESHHHIKADPNLGKRTKPGYRALFYGPPGTGKTLTASLLGKLFDLDVFRIDLSMIVSKYIGETEKNLQQVFDSASHRDWILFFDEADALFGKRTNVQSAHDRFANQEVSYLLQKVEEHPGLIILASNFRNNMDQAFMRRFQSVVYFAVPGEQERLQLWQNTLPATVPVSDKISLREFARRYELSGASILNVIHGASIRALSEQREIQENDLIEGIQNEFAKIGKSI